MTAIPPPMNGFGSVAVISHPRLRWNLGQLLLPREHTSTHPPTPPYSPDNLHVFVARQKAGGALLLEADRPRPFQPTPVTEQTESSPMPCAGRSEAEGQRLRNKSPCKVHSPPPASHFSLPFCVITKGLPLPSLPLSICGHCQRAEICESQSSYRITKDPELAKKGLKIACSSTLYMEGKAKQPKWRARSGSWGMGHPSQGSVLYPAQEGDVEIWGR